MPRWLTFDANTASRLRQQLKGDQVFEHAASGAVDYALNVRTSTVAVMPTEVPGQAAVAVIRPVLLPRAVAQVIEKRPQVRTLRAEAEGRYAPGGILGLRDEPVFEDENPVEPRKKNWWQRFWDES